MLLVDDCYAASGRHLVFDMERSVETDHVLNVNAWPDNIHINDTIVYYDTVYVYDTIFVYEAIYDTVLYYDTVYVYDIEKLKPQDASVNAQTGQQQSTPALDFAQPSFYSNWRKLSIEVFASTFSFQNEFTPPNQGNELLHNYRVSGTKPQTSFSLGANVNYQMAKNRYLQTGIEYVQLSEEVSLHHQFSLYDTLVNITINEEQAWSIDTIWIANTDSFINGSPYLMEYLDSSSYTVTLTETNEKVRERNMNIRESTINTWSYFEIPIIAAFQFQKNQWSFDAKAGITTAILLRHQRMMVYPDDEHYSIQTIETTEVSNVLLNMYVGANIAYQFHPHWSLLMEPYLKLPVSEINRAGSSSIKTNHQGLRLGMRYNF